MKKIIIIVLILLIIFVLWKIWDFNPQSKAGLSHEMSQTLSEATSRDALKNIPDQPRTLSFTGLVQKMEVSGSVKVTLNAWKHFLLEQKQGMSKYQVPADGFTFQGTLGEVSLKPGRTASLTIEVLNGPDDYFLIALDGLVGEAPDTQTIMRLQLHDKTGKALDTSNMPSQIDLTQWNSKTLNLHVENRETSAEVSTRQGQISTLSIQGQ